MYELLVNYRIRRFIALRVDLAKCETFPGYISSDVDVPLVRRYQRACRAGKYERQNTLTAARICTNDVHNMYEVA